MNVNPRLQMGIKLSTVVTGHCTLRAYYYRFKIKDDSRCVCVCNGPTDRISLNLGMCTSAKAKGHCQEQDKEGRR